MQFNKKLVAGMLGLAFVASAIPAFAGTAPTNVGVGAVLVGTCTISSPSSLAFGNFTGVANPTSASAIAVVCTTGDVFSISADAGQNAANIPASAGAVTRAMKNGTSYLGYELYTDSPHTLTWNGTNKLGATGNGGTQTYTVYGNIPPQIVPIAGTYADTVVATVSF